MSLCLVPFQQAFANEARPIQEKAILVPSIERLNDFAITSSEFEAIINYVKTLGPASENTFIKKNKSGLAYSLGCASDTTYLFLKKKKIEPIARGAFSSVTVVLDLNDFEKELVYKSAKRECISEKERKINLILSNHPDLFVVFSEIFDYTGSHTKKSGVEPVKYDPCSEQMFIPLRKSFAILKAEKLYKLSIRGRELVPKTGCILKREVGLLAYLKFLLSKQELLPFFRIISIARDILKGIEVLHKYKIVHLDIKIENTIVTKDLSAKIIDFGHARYVNELHPGTFTTDYASPQLFEKDLEGHKADYPMDMWSFGVLLVKMLSCAGDIGVSEKWNETLKEIALAAYNTRYFVSRFMLDLKESFPEEKYPEISEHLIPLVQKCLDFDPALRPSASQALEMLERLAVASKL